MKRSCFFIILVLLASGTIAQDTTVIVQQDTSRKDLFKTFHWTEKRKGYFEIRVDGYDSLKLGNNDFQNFYYFTNDKPDGKLTVRNENGIKVRECTYKNKLIFDEHWWFASGEKEFDGIWSSTLNENGDQMLVEYKWYYRNKKVRKHGFRDGITTTYYSDGKPESEKTYRNGKPDGPFKEYFPNGKLQTEGAYKKGNKSGEWVHYNMEGIVIGRDQ